MALFHCDTCGLSKDVPDKYLGRQINCPKCAGPVTIVAGDGGAIPAPRVRLRDEDGEHPHAHDVAGEASGPAPDAAPDDEAGTAEEAAPGPAAGAYDDDDDAPRAPTGPAIPIASEPVREQGTPLLQGGVAVNTAAGVLSGLQGVLLSIAFACLIFADRLLSPDFAHGLSAVLATGAVMSLFVALKSRIPFVQTGPELAAAAVVALMARSMHEGLLGVHPASNILPTLAAGTALAAFFAGCVLWFVGNMKAGHWVRFVPHQVVGGVLAGLGVHLLRAAHGYLEGNMVCLAGLAERLGWEDCFRWLPSFAAGLFMFFVARRIRHHLVVPLLFLLLLLGGVLGVHLLGAPLGGFADAGWAYPAAPAAELWTVYSRDFLSRIAWPVIWDNVPWMAALAALLVSTAMLKITDLDAETHGSFHLDHELRVLGQANILAGLLGGVPGAISGGRSMAAWRAGARGPLAGVVAGLIFVAAVALLGKALPFIPKLVPAAILVYLGLELIGRWLGDTYAMFTRKDDYGILVLVFLVTVFMGVLMGLGVGAVLAMMILISRYGKVNVVKFALSGATNRSNVDRAPSQLKILREKGGHIYIMRLQGFIFLGSTGTLVKQLRARLEASDQPEVDFVILDFRLVNGLDSAVAIGFRKLRQLADDFHVTLIFTSIPFEVERQLEEGGFALNDPDGVTRTFVDSDFALEWCEDRILEDNGALKMRENDLAEILSAVFPEPQLIPQFMRFLEGVRVEKGKYVFRQGDASDAMYFIESGRVNVQLELEGNKIIRLVKMGPGTVFGEMGIYTSAPRSASIVADEDCVLYRLSQKMLTVIQKKDPHLAAGIHRFIVGRLAERVGEANAKIRDLIK